MQRGYLKRNFLDISSRVTVLSGVEGRCSLYGQWCEFDNSVRKVESLFETRNLPLDYGLHVRRKSAGLNGAKNIVRDVWC